MAPVAPTKRKSLRPRAAERLANPLAPRKVHRPSSAVTDAFLNTKADRRLIRHSAFVSRITKGGGGGGGAAAAQTNTRTARKNQKRRETRDDSSRKLGLGALADALPELDEDNARDGNADELARGKVRHKSLRSRPGALRRKERVVRGEMERFGRSLAQLSTVAEHQLPVPVPVPAAAAAAAAGAAGEDMDEDEDEENRAPQQSTAGRFAALRGFISATMEQNPAFTQKASGKGS